MKKITQYITKKPLLSTGIALSTIAVFGMTMGTTYAYFSDQKSTSKAQLTLINGVVKLDDIANESGDGATGDNQFKLGEFDWTYLGNDSNTDGSTRARTKMKGIELPFNNTQITKDGQSFSHTLPGDVFRKIIRVGYGSTSGAVAAKYSINWENMPNASGTDSYFTNVDVQIIAGVGSQQDLNEKKVVNLTYNANGTLDDFGTTASHTRNNGPLTGNVDAKQYIEIAIYVGIRRDIESGQTETEIFKNLTKQLKVTVEQRLETRSDTSNLAVEE